MDENHQDKTESKQTATEDKLSPPPLSSKDHKGPARPQNKRMGAIIKRLGVFGYDKETKEYNPDGQLAKITKEYQPGKTLWDWLQLLIIPLVLAVGGFLFTAYQHNADQQSMLDQQQATILQTYIDNIQDLLVNHQLFSKNDFEIREIAEARTVAALSKLDPKRKGIVVQFLRNTGLIGYQDLYNHKRYPAIIFLYRADLNGADLTGTYLEYTDLSTANLTNVNLTNADLNGANLDGANLEQVNLSEAVLSGASLGCSIGGGESVSQGKTVCANLSGAKNLTQQQLDHVSSCDGASLPKGLTCHQIPSPQPTPTSTLSG